MSKIQKVPSDLIGLIWDNLSFTNIDKFFLLYPQFKGDINFWKNKLAKEIKNAAIKYPHLYVFNIKKNRQNIFFDKIYQECIKKENKINALKKTYLACLYTFDIYIEENGSYWETDNTIYWHHVRNLPYPFADSVIKYFFILLENEVSMEIITKSIKPEDLTLGHIKLLEIKYGEEFTSSKYYNEVLKTQAEKAIINSDRLINFFSNDKESKEFILDRYSKYLDNRIKTNQVNLGKYYLTPLLIYTNRLHKFKDEFGTSCFGLLKRLKNPEFDVDKKLPEIDMSLGGDNSGIENLCYYLVKKDDLNLFDKVYKECISKDDKIIAWFMVNIFNFIIPGSKIYGRIIELLPPKMYIDKISGFPLLYNLCLVLPECKFKVKSLYSDAIELISILQGKDDFKVTEKFINRYGEWDDAETCSNLSSIDSDSSSSCEK